MDTGYQSKEYSENNRAEGIDKCKSEIPSDILWGGWNGSLYLLIKIE